MTADEFRERRKFLFKSQALAAAALGVSQPCIAHYEAGRRPVPKYVEIIMFFIEAADKPGKEG